MRLIRYGLAAATVAASASAIGLPLSITGWMPRSPDATQVRVVSASGISPSETEPAQPPSETESAQPPSEAESAQPPFPNPGPQAWARPCYSYGGPYCGWVGTYWGGCDREWGLSFGIKSPYWICPHDPRPSPSDPPASSASPSPSDTPSPSGTPSPSNTPSPSGTSAAARSSSSADEDAETFDDQ
ncbi:hypothetical protein ACFW08_21295 [Streptomyces sp. NPDC058960]|uniref:hypothetical protein n=1 Tax=Streptomyces sp. NPDC058960 TaxID=3346679 RepID=UPI0036937114